MKKLVFVLVLLFLANKKRKKEMLFPGIQNNNPGNLRPNKNFKWNGEIGVDKNGLIVFSSMELGIRALGKDIINTVKNGYNTPETFFAHYAPKGDGKNNPVTYAQTVAGAIGIGWKDLLKMPEHLYSMVNAIIRVENGNQYGLVSQEQIINGLNLV